MPNEKLKCLSCGKPDASVCRPAFKCDRCHRRDEAAPEMLELLRELAEECPPSGHDNACRRGNYCPYKETRALLKRIDGDET